MQMKTDVNARATTRVSNNDAGFLTWQSPLCDANKNNIQAYIYTHLKYAIFSLKGHQIVFEVTQWETYGIYLTKCAIV